MTSATEMLAFIQHRDDVKRQRVGKVKRLQVAVADRRQRRWGRRARRDKQVLEQFRFGTRRQTG